MHGQLSRKIPEKSTRKHRYLFSRGDIKFQVEALLSTAQEQALRTNYIMHHIYKTIDSPL